MGEAHPLCGTLMMRVIKQFVVFLVRSLLALDRRHALKMDRSPLLPQVPTVREAGLPEAETEVWIGLFAPARTPDAVIGRIYDGPRAQVAGRPRGFWEGRQRRGDRRVACRL